MGAGHCFSKDPDVHEAMTYFTMYTYNFCWPVRTLRQRDANGSWHCRTPAMVAGLTDHLWKLDEWITMPAVQRELGHKGILGVPINPGERAARVSKRNLATINAPTAP